MSNFLSALKWSSILCLLLGGCSPRFSDAYIAEYQHLRDIRECASSYPQFRGEAPYSLVVLVDAKHLDYTSPEAFFTSMHYGLFLPQDPTIGHAWIKLSGKVNGKPWTFEGGHTGEFGLTAPKYFDEVVRRSLETSDPNPAQYLFSDLPDGYLQKGSGGHNPTLAVAFPLTQEEFLNLYRLIPKYDFTIWSLQDHQCVHFVLSCLAAIDVELDCAQTLHLPSEFMWKNKKIRLWQDPQYASLNLTTPDALEKSLFQEVLKKKALLAMKWYKKTN